MRLSSVRAVKAKTSCNATTETPGDSPPTVSPRPRSQSLAELQRRRITCLQRNLPVAGGSSSHDSPDQCSASALQAPRCRWSQPRLVCSAWLLAVETSYPDQAFRYASACEGLLRRMLSPGGSLNGEPPPPFRVRGLNPGIRVSATRRSRFRWAGARMLRLGPPRLRELAQTLAAARV